MPITRRLYDVIGSLEDASRALETLIVEGDMNLEHFAYTIDEVLDNLYNYVEM